MFNLSYFGSLPYTPYDLLPGLYTVADHRNRNSTRWLCTYADGQRHKTALFGLMRRLGQNEQPAEWDIHHIVEGHHYADIDFRGELERTYQHQLPCVFLHRREEHTLYSRLARTGAVSELFRGQGLPRKAVDRSKAVALEAKDPRNRAMLRKRVEDLRSYYKGVYMGDTVLSMIANNVLDEALTKL